MNVDKAIRIVREPYSDFTIEAARTLAKEIERLRAIVDKLPKTADGIPIAPRDVVDPIDHHPIEPRKIFYVYTHSAEAEIKYNKQSWWRENHLYSIREAAEAARGEG